LAKEEEAIQYADGGLGFGAPLLWGAWNELGRPRNPHVDKLRKEASVGIASGGRESAGFEEEGKDWVGIGVGKDRPRCSHQRDVVGA
jgi:hypothetical protein